MGTSVKLQVKETKAMFNQLNRHNIDEPAKQ